MIGLLLILKNIYIKNRIKIRKKLELNICFLYRLIFLNLKPCN